MIRSATFLDILRRERGPLATLAALAMLARVVVGVLGLMTVAPASAAPGGLVICSGAGGGSQSVPGSPAAAFDCACTACHHAGCAASCGLLRAELSFPAPDLVPAGLSLRDRPAPVTARAGEQRRIRAPPHA